MTLASGTRLGPYEIVESLGAGGMGEVYRAHDPRLKRDVALKVILEAGESPSRDRLKRFEDEVRAAAALSHPNVLTVFDVGSDDGRPYVVFELLEGRSLREVLEEGPLPLRRAVDLGIQVCRGLEAAHARQLIHRNLKPANLFLTTDGVVKILDFGLAKLLRDEEGPFSVGASGEGTAARTDTAPGTILGTLGYLSPEQVRGQEADARADLFSLGAVLYETVSDQRAFSASTPADTLSAILHGEPAPLVSPSGPVPPALERIVRRCLEKDPRDRFHSAHDVALALEAVGEAPAPSVGAEGSEERSPYPGLRYFTQDDAGRFFGREGEIESLWERLKTRPLLAVIGPSGAGKSSFIRAGVVASHPTGWGALVSTPGSQAFRGLGEALAPELAGDADALKKLLEFEETAFELVTRWRSRHGEALLVVDQLEELYTLNSPEVQERFAELLGRLAAEGDVHVVLSLRDDFLMRCGEHEALQRVFTELTPLYPLSTDGLRRAVEEPARREGFSFEEGLVEEMLNAVVGARGALPLLAFAVSRLWEKRDREKKLLTRTAYQAIGGVAGALAQHAEQTLDRIGAERQPLVRELFRNLVTAQGTRASSEREELLSVFPEKKEAASEVLQELIGARLLTSYEVPLSHPEGGDAEQRPKDLRSEGAVLRRHRIEVVHESLLKAWPRLVMWQAQEEEGALLRDQLRQAAHVWEEKGRSNDVLWTGRAFREFELWRERYPGTLTALEEDFARAMVERDRRRRRLRRLVATSVVVVALAVAGVTGVLWWRGEQAREEALTEARRAEAAQLRAVGTLYVDEDPSAALAYAIAGLERFDSPPGRRFALEALAAGPPGLFVDVDPTRPTSLEFSPDGKWVGAAGCFGARILPRDGGAAVVLDDEGYLGECSRRLRFAADGDHVVLSPSDQRVVRVWSLSQGAEVKRFEWEGMSFPSLVGNRLLMDTVVEGRPVTVREYDLGSGELKTLERWDARGVQWWDVDPAGRRVALTRVDDNRVFVRPFWGQEPAVERVVGRHATSTRYGALSPQGDRLASVDAAGEIRVWSLDAPSETPLRTLQAEGWITMLRFDPSGTRLAAGYSSDDGANTLVRVWDLEGPEGAEPVALRSALYEQPFPAVAFDPTAGLAVVSYLEALGFFSLEGRAHVLPGGSNLGGDVAFTPDGRTLLTGYEDGPLIRTWRLDGQGQRDLKLSRGQVKRIAVGPKGRHVVVAGLDGAFLVDLSDGTSRELPDTSPRGRIGRDLAVSADGRLAAAACLSPPEHEGIRVWDLESLELRVLEESRGRDVHGLAFAPDGTLFSSDASGVVSRWDLRTDRRTTLAETGQPTVLALSPDGRHLLTIAGTSEEAADAVTRSTLHDLVAGTSRPFTSHGAHIVTAAFDPTKQWIVTGDRQGVVRVGPVTGETPHLLLGHGTSISSVAASPDGRWIASSEGLASTVRLWRWPEGPPPRTLPYPELMARLRAMTNLRAVPDTTSPMGYRLEVGPFPGWAALER